MVLAKVARIDGAGRVLASVALTLALVMLAAVAQTVDSHQVFLLHHVLILMLSVLQCGQNVNTRQCVRL